MITLNITPEGEITISQETGQERAAMNAVYNTYNGAGEEPSNETSADEQRAEFFKQGWDSAIRECQINYVNGRILEFFQEMNHPLTRSEDPHHDEPEGTGEVGDTAPAAGWASDEDKEARETEARFAANEIGLDVIRPVADSGEPEQEKNQTWDPKDDGTWTMSNAELNSRLDATYERGLRDGETSARRTTRRSLEMIAIELNIRVLNEWDREVLNTVSEVKHPITKGEYAKRLAVLLAERLGFEVSE